MKAIIKLIVIAGLVYGGWYTYQYFQNPYRNEPAVSNYEKYLDKAREATQMSDMQDYVTPRYYQKLLKQFNPKNAYLVNVFKEAVDYTNLEYLGVSRVSETHKQIEFNADNVLSTTMGLGSSSHRIPNAYVNCKVDMIDVHGIWKVNAEECEVKIRE